MKSAWARTICRLLIVLMIWTPYQIAQAGMIGTDQVATASSQADRSAVLGFVTRADVASQLQALGLDAATAKDRVAAMTDSEVSVSRRADRQPARGRRHRRRNPAHPHHRRDLVGLEALSAIGRKAREDARGIAGVFSFAPARSPLAGCASMWPQTAAAARGAARRSAAEGRAHRRFRSSRRRNTSAARLRSPPRSPPSASR